MASDAHGGGGAHVFTAEQKMPLVEPQRCDCESPETQLLGLRWSNAPGRRVDDGAAVRTNKAVRGPPDARSLRFHFERPAQTFSLGQPRPAPAVTPRSRLGV
ncbi:hypothetical protein PSPO01_11189 [Paraphaeosphaeria sporulosa]